jgi:hypothetical protein
MWWSGNGAYLKNNYLFSQPCIGRHTFIEKLSNVKARGRCGGDQGRRNPQGAALTVELTSSTTGALVDAGRRQQQISGEGAGAGGLKLTIDHGAMETLS